VREPRAEVVARGLGRAHGRLQRGDLTLELHRVRARGRRRLVRELLLAHQLLPQRLEVPQERTPLLVCASIVRGGEEDIGERRAGTLSKQRCASLSDSEGPTAATLGSSILPVRRSVGWSSLHVEFARGECSWRVVAGASPAEQFEHFKNLHECIHSHA
jgi:hypothetical protein